MRFLNPSFTSLLPFSSLYSYLAVARESTSGFRIGRCVLLRGKIESHALTIGAAATKKSVLIEVMPLDDARFWTVATHGATAGTALSERIGVEETRKIRHLSQPSGV